MKNRLVWIIALAMCWACSSDSDEEIGLVSILSIVANGATLEDGQNNIPIQSSFAITFSSAIDPVLFENNLSIQSTSGNATYESNYSNASSRVTLELNLEHSTSYTLTLGQIAIGASGQLLDEAVTINFTTADSGIITSLAPCTSASNDCYYELTLVGKNGSGTFHYYSNYPIYEEEASWENLKNAIIVIHGASRNPDDYFNYIASTLKDELQDESTILISPYFKDETNISNEEFYWDTVSGWREGQLSDDPLEISSYAVIDSIIAQLNDTEHFPVLENIIVTGHSSGALFTHAFAAANTSETIHTGMNFEYVVANSQYFYYPSNDRYNESTQQFYEPSGCTPFNFWPLGFDFLPDYLNGVTLETFNNQFISRKITYLLGNGNQSDPTLNTNDCEYTLLGSSRFNRGENMFRYMENFYSGTHNHSKAIVNGIGHNGQGMYQSTEFRTLLNNLLE